MCDDCASRRSYKPCRQQRGQGTFTVYTTPGHSVSSSIAANFAEFTTAHANLARRRPHHRHVSVVAVSQRRACARVACLSDDHHSPWKVLASVKSWVLWRLNDG